MNETKECRDTWRYASSASLKFETNRSEPLEVGIFMDRTSARMTLWIAEFKCGIIQYDHVLDSEENLQKMVHFLNCVREKGACCKGKEGGCCK